MNNIKFLYDIVDLLSVNEKLSDIFHRVYLILESNFGSKNFVLVDGSKVIFGYGREIKNLLRVVKLDGNLQIGETYCGMDFGEYKVYFDFKLNPIRESLVLLYSILKNFFSNYSKFEYIYKRFKYLKSLVFAVEPIMYETSIKSAFSQSLISFVTFTQVERGAILSFDGKSSKVIASVELDKDLLKLVSPEIHQSIKVKKDITLFKELDNTKNKYLITIVPLVDLGEVKGVMVLVFGKDKKALDETDREVLRVISFILTHRLKLYETNLNLIKAKKRAEELSRLKSEFVANVSHELRTPLNAILGFVELLKMGNFSKEEEIKYLDYILSSGYSLLSMVNNILDLSKIEAGMMKPVLQEIDLEELITDLKNYAGILARNKGIEFFIYKSHNIPKKIISDYTMVRSIINNLLSNAIKFTDKGWVKFWVYTKDENLIFKVEDTGVGIKEGDLKKIFDTFVQLESTRNKRYPGTGIGLSLSQKFAEMLNARIIPKTKGLGNGTVFYFVLPILLTPSEEGLKPT